MSYLKDRLARKNGILPKLPTKKEKKPLKRISDKKLMADKAAKEEGKDEAIDVFFMAMRPKMTGKCLFCNSPSMKKDDDKFHFSIAHLLAKSIFKSVAKHEDNWIELCFYNNSCHSNFDSGKITWEFIKDSKEWEMIKEKLINILPMVAIEERKNKLYGKLQRLVYGDPL